MKTAWLRRSLWLPLILISLSAAAAVCFLPNLRPFQDATGAVATFNTGGDLDRQNAFFQSLGSNGRTCATCHQPDQAFGLSAGAVQAIYRRTHGRDPLFAAVDGANCPTAASQDRVGHSLLLERGLFRIALPVPQNAEFTIEVVHDPYGCAITTDPATGRPVISVYRRPQPATNLRFLSAVMFDGRETVMPLNNQQTYVTNLYQDLTHQAIDAIEGHSQATGAPSATTVDEIVRFESGLSTAQIEDNRAGRLHRDGAAGGPLALAGQDYYPGMNDALGGDPDGQTFNPRAFSLYTTWQTPDDPFRRRHEEHYKAREEIAAGEELFNTAPLVITGVRGLNDNPSLGSPESIAGTCTTCHDTPNVGNHSVALPLDIGTSRLAAYETDLAITAALGQISAPDLPIYAIKGCPDPSSPAETVNYYTSDPGKALITGLCADVNRGKGPILRGLAARAPYFHNGAARNLEELVNFYNQRFQMHLTAKQQKDLIAFLNSL
jgi:cytochrome c peroxidase